MAVDDEQNMYLAGYFTLLPELIEQGQGPSARLIKLSFLGEVEWFIPQEGRSLAEVEDVALDIDGNPIVAGFWRAQELFGDLLVESTSWDDGFLSKYGSDGTYLWSKFFQQEDGQQCKALAITAEGIFASGTYSGKVDFGDSFVLDSKLAGDTFVIQVAR
jgi:hypothetical protein